MSKFAKLFDFEDIGQVLAKLDSGDEGAEVRVYFKPKNLGVCSTAFTFLADASGNEWDKAEKAFGLFDELMAHRIVTDVLKLSPIGALSDDLEA